MQPCQRLARGVRMRRSAERRPGDRVFIKVHALGRIMHLVGPLAHFDCSLAGRGGKNARHLRSSPDQMMQKTMFLQQSLPVAHRAMMAFDEDTPTCRSHHAGRRKRPRAHRQNLDRLTAAWELPKQRAHFGKSQRRPVGFHQPAVHSVRFACCAHCIIHILNRKSKTCNALRAAPWWARPAR